MMMFATENEDKKTAAKAEDTKDTEETAAPDPEEGMSDEEIRKLHEDYRRFGIEGEDEESMDSIADALSTFQSEQEEESTAKEEKAGRKSDISKKKFWIPIWIGAAVLGTILYFAVLRPMLESFSEEEVPDINTWLRSQVEAGEMSDVEYNELLNQGKCEVLGSQNRILMFNHVEKADIQSVEVHNDFGTYTFYRDSSDNFVILGAETATYDKELLSSLVVSSGYTLSMTRVSENCEDLSEYGLAKADNPAYYTLTTTKGITHTVYIGDPIPTGAGFYCAYEDRPAVYVLDSTLAATLLADVRSLMTAILTYPISANSYYTVSDFTMTKNGEPFLQVDYLTDAERVQTASNSIWKMVYPEGGYTPSSVNYDGMLQTFSNFVGSRVVEFNVLGSTESEELTEEQLEMFVRYDLAEPETTVSFDYTVPDPGFTVTNSVWISSKTENDTYYVYSWLFDIIGEIDAASYPWIEYDLLDFIDRPVFQMNINNVASIEISGRGADSDMLTTDFHLEGDGQALVVEDQVTGKVVETQNFRQLYKTMLSIAIEGYTEDDSADESTLIAEMKITTESGIETDYRFYAYSTRRCFMTINGEGEFYVLRDQAEKLISDARKIIAGVKVDSDARS